MNTPQQGWNNGLSPGDFAQYKDGTIVRVLEIVPKFYTSYSTKTKIETWSRARCWKVILYDITSAYGQPRQKQSYKVHTLKKLNVAELIDNLKNCAKIVEEESKKVV